MQSLIVKNLSAGYPGLRNALQNVSFTVNQGERIGILGPNGAGKSTLFKALVGLIPFRTGEISASQADCRDSHQLIGYVPQQEQIDWTFPVTVKDVVMMGRVRRIGWGRIATRPHRLIADQMLDLVGMADFRHRQIGELSGGQRRRVFIARALAQETRVLLLDEPFSGIDVSAEQDILQVLDRLAEEGVTVLLATHNLNTAPQLFDRLMMLKQTCIAYGTPEEVFTPENLQMVYGNRVGVFHTTTGDTVLVTDNHSG